MHAGQVGAPVLHFAALCPAQPHSLLSFLMHSAFIVTYLNLEFLFFFFLFVGHSGKQHLHLEKSTCWLRKPSICCWLLLLLPEVLCLLSNAVLLTSVLSSASRPHLCTWASSPSICCAFVFGYEHFGFKTESVVPSKHLFTLQSPAALLPGEGQLRARPLPADVKCIIGVTVMDC